MLYLYHQKSIHLYTKPNTSLYKMKKTGVSGYAFLGISIEKGGLMQDDRAGVAWNSSRFTPVTPKNFADARLL